MMQACAVGDEGEGRGVKMTMASVGVSSSSMGKLRETLESGTMYA